MPWYKDFFEKWYLDLWLLGERFKPSYIKKEVAFIKRVLRLSKGAKILDLCCGHGRHTLPLAKIDYQMTGLDLSKNALNMLKESTKRQGLNIRIVRGDMRRIPFKDEFDAVINMFTAFGYLENSKEDLRVLKQIAKALKPGGKFLIDVVNKDWVLANFQPRYWRKIGGRILLEERIYNPKTSCNTAKNELIEKNGKAHKFYTKVRIYSLNDLKKKLDKAGLKVIRVYGDTLGGVKFKKDSRRLVILSEKQK